MQRTPYRGSMFTAAFSLAGAFLAFGVTQPLLADTLVYGSGFETPTYTADDGTLDEDLNGQDGWTLVAGGTRYGDVINNTTATANSFPAVPSGNQMAFFGEPGTGSDNNGASRSISAIIDTSLTIEVLMATNNQGTAVANEASILKLTSVASAFGGLQFGFYQGNLSARNGSTWTAITPEIGQSAIPVNDTFYKFIALFDADSDQWALEVRLASDNTLVGGLSGLASRNGVTTFETLSLDLQTTDDDLFVDDIQVLVVPEPASLGLLATGVFLTLLGRRRGQSVR